MKLTAFHTTLTSFQIKFPIFQIKFKGTNYYVIKRKTMYERWEFIHSFF